MKRIVYVFFSYYRFYWCSISITGGAAINVSCPRTNSCTFLIIIPTLHVLPVKECTHSLCIFYVWAVAARRGTNSLVFFLPPQPTNAQALSADVPQLCCCSHFLGELINIRGAQTPALNRLSLDTWTRSNIPDSLISNPGIVLPESYCHETTRWHRMVTYRLPKDKAIFLGPHRARAVVESNQSGLRVVGIRNQPNWSQRNHHQ